MEGANIRQQGVHFVTRHIAARILPEIRIGYQRGGFQHHHGSLRGSAERKGAESE